MSPLFGRVAGGVTGEDCLFVGGVEGRELAETSLEAVDAAALADGADAVDIDDEGNQAELGVFVDDPVFGFGVVEIEAGVFEAAEEAADAEKQGVIGVWAVAGDLG